MPTTCQHLLARRPTVYYWLEATAVNQEVFGGCPGAIIFKYHSAYFGFNDFPTLPTSRASTERLWQTLPPELMVWFHNTVGCMWICGVIRIPVFSGGYLMNFISSSAVIAAETWRDDRNCTKHSLGGKKLWQNGGRNRRIMQLEFLLCCISNGCTIVANLHVNWP